MYDELCEDDAKALDDDVEGLEREDCLRGMFIIKSYGWRLFDAN